MIDEIPDEIKEQNRDLPAHPYSDYCHCRICLLDQIARIRKSRSGIILDQTAINSELRERAEQLERERDIARALVVDICREWNEDCDPCCDSYGHSESCRATYIAAAKRALNSKCAQLERERDEAMALQECAERGVLAMGAALDEARARVRELERIAKAYLDTLDKLIERGEDVRKEKYMNAQAAFDVTSQLDNANTRRASVRAALGLGE